MRRGRTGRRRAGWRRRRRTRRWWAGGRRARRRARRWRARRRRVRWRRARDGCRIRGAQARVRLLRYHRTAALRGEVVLAGDVGALRESQRFFRESAPACLFAPRKHGGSAVRQDLRERVPAGALLCDFANSYVGPAVRIPHPAVAIAHLPVLILVCVAQPLRRHVLELGIDAH